MSGAYGLSYLSIAMIVLGLLCIVLMYVLRGQIGTKMFLISSGYAWILALVFVLTITHKWYIQYAWAIVVAVLPLIGIFLTLIIKKKQIYGKHFVALAILLGIIGLLL